MCVRFEKTMVAGFEPAIEGMRFPTDTNDKSDSYTDENGNFILGKDDARVAKMLIRQGASDAKFQRQIWVWVTITAPLYFWSEFKTYRQGTSDNSASTMRGLHKREVTLYDFETDGYSMEDFAHLNADIAYLNKLRAKWLDTRKVSDRLMMKKHLPDSYMLKNKICINYQTLTKIYHERRKHALSEWNTDFINWMMDLPYAKELIIGE